MTHATARALAPDAGAAYDALAPAYDALTKRYAYDRWLIALEALAAAHGLAGRRLLDIACGTGKSFLPLYERGYETTACDLSARMLEIARCKAPDACLHQADMRELPVLGRFDLVTCLDDALNYVLDEHELEAALAGIARNLADGGVALWDLNTIAQYRGQFARDHVIASGGMLVAWRGSSAPEAPAGALVEFVLDVFAHAGGEDWRRTSHVHRQRHWARAAVQRLAERAGLHLLDVRGQHPGAVIDGELDELVHTKAIYVAALAKGGPR